MLVCGFRGSMKAIAFGAFLLVGVLVFSSILLVQYVHPSNVEVEYGDCERCSRGFATVIQSSLTLYQQIVAGDGWGQTSVPNIENDWKAAVILPLVHIVIGLGVMNLILAVIVDRAVEAREATKEETMHLKLEEQLERKKELVKLFAELDLNENGELDFAEVCDAYDNSISFRAMMVQAGVHKQDLPCIFQFLDKDSTGEVGYVEFCDTLEGISQQDPVALAGLANMKISLSSKQINERFDNILGEFTGLLSKLDHKLDRVLVESGLAAQESIELAQAPTGNKETEGTLDHDERLLDSPKGAAMFEKLKFGSQKISMAIAYAQQTEVAVVPQQSGDMTDVLRCFQELKYDINQQEAERTRKLREILGSALSSLNNLGMGSSALPLDGKQAKSADIPAAGGHVGPHIQHGKTESGSAFWKTRHFGKRQDGHNGNEQPGHHGQTQGGSGGEPKQDRCDDSLRCQRKIII